MISRATACLTLFTLLVMVQSVMAQPAPKKTVDVPYMPKVPYGVTAWQQSQRVQKGIGKETRFVPYNSDLAIGTNTDADALKKAHEESATGGKETSFYMAYDAKGWAIYIHCQHPEIEQLENEQKEVSLELYFAPGQENVPYYQVMIRQIANTATFVDWGTPQKDYRSMQGSVRTESLVLDDGVATFIYIPWDRLYDQLPLNGESWLFSFMRWDTRVTWGGNVHDTGNFGLVKFEKPSEEVRDLIENRLITQAQFAYESTAKKLTTQWGDEKLGDEEFNTRVLQPLLAEYGKKLLEIRFHSDLRKAHAASMAMLKNWNELEFIVSDVREKYLRDKQLGQLDQTPASGDIKVYPIKAITGIKRLPTDPGEAIVPGSVVSIVAAKGEFEPASFLVKSNTNLPRVELVASDLTMGQSSITAENVDIKIVKVWYQGGTAWYSYFADPNRRELVPELLLNDETLVRVDHKTQDNFLRIGDDYRWITYPKSKDKEYGKFNIYKEPVADSQTLKPIELVSGQYKQIWVTVKVPASSQAGLYQGRIDLLVDGKIAGQVTLAVKVLPYELPLPMTYYDLDKSFVVSMFGTSILRLPEVEKELTPEARDKWQMAIFKNILDHGVYNNRSTLMLTNLHKQKDSDLEDYLRHELRMLKKAGFIMKPLIARGWVYTAGNETREDVFKRLDRFIAIAEEEIGHRDIYLATWDVASVSRVLVYRDLAEYVHSKGIKLWATTIGDRQLTLAGHVIDYAIQGGTKPNRADAAKWHALGAMVGSVVAPHTGIENPDVYRRWEGMARYKAHYDSSYNMYYFNQQSNPNIWNEANSLMFRSFNMVYPTINGVIDTIAWEGFREGIDDIRYATKLKQDAAKAIASGYYPAELAAKKALLWLEVTDDQQVDLNTMRMEMIEQIEKIDAAMEQGRKLGS